MKKLWIGIVEMKITEDAEPGYTAGFTNFITWAESEEGFKKNVLECLYEYGWRTLSAENIRPVDPRLTYSEEIEEIIERARDNPHACIFSTFHTYPLN